MSIVLRKGRAPKATYPESAEYVRACRRELGWSQGALAGVLVRAVETVRDWEQGSSRLPGTVRRALLDLVSWKRTGVLPRWLGPLDQGLADGRLGGGGEGQPAA